MISWPPVTGRPIALKALSQIGGKSPYRDHAHAGVYTGGANAVYWFDILTDHGDGTVTARNITEGAKRQIESVQVRLEKELLYPLLRGRDVHRWRANPSAFLLFVQDPKTRSGIDEETMARDYPLALQWLERNRRALESRSAYKRYFQRGKDSFFTMFDVGEYTLAKFRVSWRRVANELDVAVVNAASEPRVLSDSTLVEITCESLNEGYFVAGVMNSTFYRLAVANYIVLHPDVHILGNLYVPKYDASCGLHREIKAEAERLSSGADDVDAPVHEALDQLCARIWKIGDPSAITAVQNAFLELYGSPASSPELEEATADE